MRVPTLPPGIPCLQDWVADVADIEFLKTPSGALQELGAGARCGRLASWRVPAHSRVPCLTS